MFKAAAMAEFKVKMRDSSGMLHSVERQLVTMLCESRSVPFKGQSGQEILFQLLDR
jgi:hypothetical protein